MTDPASSKLRVILTGATGMVGEGVLLECLENPMVDRVLSVSRKSYGGSHPKLTQCLVPDFMDLTAVTDTLRGYDACFYCAGVSSLGKKEPEYTRITHDTTLSFARTLLGLDPRMVFTFVTGAGTDTSEKGSMMWARVKGRTENALAALGFRGAFNFRPGMMTPTRGQKSLPGYVKPLGFLLTFARAVAPKQVLSLKEVGEAMLECVVSPPAQSVLEIKDILALAKRFEAR